MILCSKGNKPNNNGQIVPKLSINSYFRKAFPVQIISFTLHYETSVSPPHARFLALIQISPNYRPVSGDPLLYNFPGCAIHA